MRFKKWWFFHKVFSKRHHGNVGKLKIPKITKKHFPRVVYWKLNVLITWFFMKNLVFNKKIT